MIKKNKFNNQELKKRIGVILDSSLVEGHIIELIKWSKDKGLDFSHAIISDSSSKNLEFNLFIFLHNCAQKLIFRLIYFCELNKLKQNELINYVSKKNINEFVSTVVTYQSWISNSKILNYTNNQSLEQDIDLLLCFQNSKITKKYYDETGLQIISINYSHDPSQPSVCNGFWEVFKRVPTTGFKIEIYNSSNVDGLVLECGSFPTQPYFLLNRANVYRRANFYLKRTLISLFEVGTENHACKISINSGSAKYIPGLIVLLTYIYLQFSRFLYRKFRFSILKKNRRWSVAFAHHNWPNLVMHDANLVPNLPGRFFADPFVISYLDSNFCFVEDFDYKSQRGCISVLKLENKTSKFVSKIIVEPFHMSFPYVFTNEGRMFLIPETSENLDIRMYECVEFPGEWILAKIIKNDVSAADTMIFKRDNIWWLFTNIAPTDGADHSSELFIFYSTDLFADDWLPHSLNPIYIDPMIARNGGILQRGDDVYRVSQKYGFCRYGVGSTILKIVELTPETFIEIPVLDIEPNFFKGLHGTHHLHSNGTVTVFDCLTEEVIDH